MPLLFSATDADHGSTFALTANGTLWAWGGNDYGQLGDGTGAYRSLPVRVTGLANVASVVSGGLHSAAVRSDGTVWAWGFNLYGQVGDGTTADRFSPVAVASLSGVGSLAIGVNHTLALRSDGLVFAWGRNDKGQLGDGTRVDRSVPVAVIGLSNHNAFESLNAFFFTFFNTDVNLDRISGLKGRDITF